MTGPISMGQCDARSTKHSVQTFFRIIFCCCDGNCWKCSLSLACLTHATKICAITLKFKVWFASNENGTDFTMRFVANSESLATSNRCDDWIIGFCFRGPRSSCTATCCADCFFSPSRSRNWKWIIERAVSNKTATELRSPKQNKAMAHHLHSFAFEGSDAVDNAHTSSVLLCRLHNSLCQLSKKKGKFLLCFCFVSNFVFQNFFVCEFKFVGIWCSPIHV